VLEDKRPLTVKYDAIKGTAYRLLCCLGDVYILTSKGLYVLAKLGERFVKGQLVQGITTPVLPIPMQATDTNLYRDQCLLVVMLDEVQKYDIKLIHDSIPEFLSQGRSSEQQPTTLNPVWKQRGVGISENATRLIAVGA
jgi:hypothetical protein